MPDTGVRVRLGCGRALGAHDGPDARTAMVHVLWYRKFFKQHRGRGPRHHHLLGKGSAVSCPRFVVTGPVLAAAGLAIGSMMNMTSAQATTCFYERLTLAQAYERADSIVVAEATDCKGDERPVSGACSSHWYEFEKLEVLKEAKASEDAALSLAAAGPMGCGMHFWIGGRFLLFLDDQSRPIVAASGYLSGDDLRTVVSQERLNVLRDYRDGRRPDLSEPWRFSDYGVACSLSHAFEGGSLGLTFAYAQGDYGRLEAEVTRSPDGELELRAKPADPSFQPRAPRRTSARARRRGGVSANVMLFDHASVVPDSVVVAVGGVTWSTERLTIESGGGPTMPPTYGGELLIADTGLAFFSALEENSALTISGLRENLTEESSGPPIAFSYETTTTYFDEAGKKFRACIDGSGRRPHPELP